MRFAQIRSMDISNGEGVGVSLFVQGCDRHCFNCFNSETWNFNGGKEWTEETKNKFMELIDRPYIRRISILGGEPLAEQNLNDILSLVKEIRILYPEKTIWSYTGYQWEQIMLPIPTITDDLHTIEITDKRKKIISNVNVLVDGEYIDEQKDLTLKFKGSKNQRVIDVQQSLAQNKIILYCD
mgnify:CR=1 FL=1